MTLRKYSVKQVKMVRKLNKYGWSNAEIARYLKMHPVTVTNILLRKSHVDVGTVECPTCEGHGIINFRICPTCNGRKRVEED